MSVHQQQGTSAEHRLVTDSIDGSARIPDS